MTVKEKNLEVEVVHGCFTGVNDSILSTFSWSLQFVDCISFVHVAILMKQTNTLSKMVKFNTSIIHDIPNLQ